MENYKSTNDYLYEIMILLDKHEKNNKNLGELLYNYLYNSYNLNDNFLANLLLDNIPFNKKEHIGYICYLKEILKSRNDRKLIYNVWLLIKKI